MGKLSAICYWWWSKRRRNPPTPPVPKEIVSAAAQTDVTVFYGTLFGDVPLPTSVVATLDDASTVSLPVTWAVGTYDEDVLATYTLTGTFNTPLPTGIVNTGNITASIDVIVEARELTGAPTFEDQSVANGTVFASLDLPDSGLFLAEDNSTIELAIVWAAGSYNGSVAATYTLLGTPTLITGFINPGTVIKAEIDVIVASAEAPSFTASTFGIVGDVLGGSLTYTGSEEESNIPPHINSVVLAGTLQEGEDGEITIEVENNTGYAIDTATIEIYRASNQQGGSEALSGTVDSGDISVVGNTVTGTYTFLPGDVGKYVRAEVVVTLANGVNADSEPASSLWSDDTVEAAVVVGGFTYIGSSSNPADNGTLAASPVAVTPVPGLIAGDFVIMWANTRTASSTVAISQAGGQTWTPLTSDTMTANTCRGFICQFNGTWSADPSVSMSGSVVANTVVMHAFRPTSPAHVVTIDQAMVTANNVAPVSFEVTIAALTNVAASTLSIAVWSTADDNQWGATAGSWTILGSSQYRNVAGSDIGLAFAYKVMTSAGSTGTVGRTQTSVGPDNCITQIVSFKETL